MPHGDYGEGSHLQPITVNITFDSDLRIAEVGIGYHVITPSGRRHDSGYTWHRPQTGEQGATDHIVALQAVMDELLRAAADYEGVKVAHPSVPISDRGLKT